MPGNQVQPNEAFAGVRVEGRTKPWFVCAVRRDDFVLRSPDWLVLLETRARLYEFLKRAEMDFTHNLTSHACVRNEQCAEAIQPQTSNTAAG